MSLNSSAGGKFPRAASCVTGADHAYADGKSMENSDHSDHSDHSDQTALVNRYLAAYNAFDVDGMLAVLSPEVRFENYSGGQLAVAANGIDEFRQLAEQSKALFCEREQRITALEAAEGALIAGIAYRGRLCADIPNGPRAGTLLALQGTSEFSFNGGAIIKIVDRS